MGPGRDGTAGGTGQVQGQDGERNRPGTGDGMGEENGPSTEDRTGREMGWGRTGTGTLRAWPSGSHLGFHARMFLFFFYISKHMLKKCHF